jgi:hypothetical protein
MRVYIPLTRQLRCALWRRPADAHQPNVAVSNFDDSMMFSSVFIAHELLLRAKIHHKHIENKKVTLRFIAAIYKLILKK